jgi:DNA-directed RNA polymerase subunit alpha
VDAIYSPVRKANYTVQQTRVGQMTDYERLVLEVWTDGSIAPTEAVQRAAQQVVDLLLPFTALGKAPEGAGARPSLALTIPPEIYNTPVERLELSSRTLNCLKRANINKVGEILEKSRAELMKIRNFGDKSMEELLNRLREKEFPIPETLAPSSSVAEAEAQVPAKEE